VLEKAPANIKDICPTDEYAIKDFRSICRKQITLVKTPPQTAKANIKEIEYELKKLKYW